MSWEAWGDPPEAACEVCGEYAHNCICPECPACGAAGDPACYPAHGLERTEEQIQSAIRNDPSDDDFIPGA